MVGVLLSVLVVGGGAALYLYRVKRGGSQELPSVASALATTTLTPVEFIPPKFDFLHDLSFEDAVDEATFGSHVLDVVQKGLAASAGQFSPDLANLSLQVGSLGQDGWWVSFSDGQHYELVKKVATGELIPQAKMPVGFGPHAVVDHSAMFLNQLAGYSAIGLSLCHMVSGADNSRKLRALLEGQQLVFAHRRTGQKNQLKTAYEDLQKQFRRPAANPTSVDSICSRFREARLNILDDACTTLRGLQPLFPDRKGWFKGARELKDLVLRGPGTRPYLERQAKLAGVVSQIRLAAASVRFEHLALSASGELAELPHLYQDVENSTRSLFSLFEPLEHELVWASDGQERITPMLEDLFRMELPNRSEEAD